ncbi:hypothetical protein WSM22_40720 [Cytophagales bacterium WSM2-2]|nr:hypothetical protein WSM22_40720 [Cytophagales bacterium WSM2-2]
MQNIIHHLSQMLATYAQATKRIFFIDYDGTLAPLQLDPKLAIPTRRMKESLLELTKDSFNHIVIISGREKETLDAWLGDLPVTLVAEHGGFLKDCGNDWNPLFDISTQWMNWVLPPLQALTFNYEGTFIEKKYYSVAWHYRGVTENISEHDIKEITNAFSSLTMKDEFVIYNEDCTLEFRTSGIDKGKVAALYMQNDKYDFVLAIGDGKTDEDIFKAIGKNHYTIKVGDHEESNANFYLEKQSDTLIVFNSLSLEIK